MVGRLFASALKLVPSVRGKFFRVKETVSVFYSCEYLGMNTLTV